MVALTCKQRFLSSSKLQKDQSIMGKPSNFDVEPRFATCTLEVLGIPCLPTRIPYVCASHHISSL